MKRLPALPLFLQTLCLVIITLVVAQVLAVAVILNLPPPPPLVYTVAEVAQVVRAQGAPNVPATHVLQVTTAAAPPARATVGRRRVHFRDALAQALNLSPNSVVIDQSGTRIVALGGRRAPPPREMLRDAPEPLLMGGFTIGVRQSDGRWLIISPRTALGIDPWQERLLLVLALSAIAVSPLAWLFSRRIAAPIAALAAGAERLGRDPLAPPLDVSGSAEVAAAAAAFNEMQQRLRQYVDERVGMLGAIAHDLRTPLTRVRFRIEAVPDPLRAKLIQDIDQMEAMVASVLGFVRDAVQPRQRRKVDLASLVETVMDEAALTGSDATATEMERVVVEADPLALKRLVVNLVDNAIKFGGRVRARVFIRGAEAVVEIDDDGPGMPEADLDRVFEPFRRLEESRSRETGGIGLGLSVVRAIARGHGGDVVLSNRRTGGLRATVTLPLCADTPVRRPAGEAPARPGEPAAPGRGVVSAQ